ncbi:MAG: zinc metalloprotease HtpX [Candidatus Nealsonbacteria bacterium CG_4_10_14_0_2_um_filter_37_10]|uniref:Protease HtpX homolog n=2 Tax=Candidatus Nealsoniibacteriota TaxID=1817911 RepID=A0A2H0TJW0_9BACT|nr:MAG: zinc metalloprotease HtpX [Candidatus Nealsonbacteria bacterium CG10_big_fil_rev_8_21_14_0_10_37_25]PIZ89576.1 MAG: zinc metalloprotease HtpX [Candidatus Nealsonbacteria bacterium CG_4_10_14_0_2_um_filter_37_10]
MTLYTQAESNSRKTWLYLTGFFILVIAVGWLISYFLQSPAILYLAVILSIILNFFAYWYSDKIVLSLSQAREIKKADNLELYRLVENLCIIAGLPLPRIYIIDSSQPNAFATGRDAKHAVVAVTRGLLEKLDRVELEGVLSHELSHIGNKDILLQTIVVVLVGFVVILTDFFFRIAFWRDMTGRSREGGQLRLIMILVALALAILAPLFAQLIKLAISRKREFLADASGALLTRYPEGLARALEKISRDANPLEGASNATSHLYITSPFRGKEKTSWLHKLFMTHPPVEERIKALRNLKI